MLNVLHGRFVANPAQNRPSHIIKKKKEQMSTVSHRDWISPPDPPPPNTHTKFTDFDTHNTHTPHTTYKHLSPEETQAVSLVIVL